MSDSPRLGGFKILNDVMWVSLIGPAGDDTFATRLCHVLSAREINLPFLTVGGLGSAPGVHFVVEMRDVPRIEDALKQSLEPCEARMREAGVLSLFPHKSDPLVLGTLLDALGGRDIRPLALANSHSAISVVLDEASVDKAVAAMFGPFHISSYRTAVDWKLAQKGKEALFKEVIASYREKRPKVYGLGLHKTQELLDVTFESHQLGQMGQAFKAFSKAGRLLTFLISLPTRDALFHFLFCLPAGSEFDDTIWGMTHHGVAVKNYPVTLFTMNGPHFGDRYGIAEDILDAFDRAQVDLFGLGCSVASIVGVFQTGHVDRAVAAIKGCCDVPTIMFNA